MAKRKSTFQQNEKKKKKKKFKNQMNSKTRWILTRIQAMPESSEKPNARIFWFEKGQCLHAAMTVVIQNFQRLLYICIKQEQGYLMKIRNWTDHSYRVHRWTVQSRGGMWDTERTNCGRSYGLLYQDPRTLCYESTIQYMARLTLVLYHD